MSSQVPMTEAEELEALHQTLEATTEFMTRDEMEVLVEVAQGLVRGQEVHGFMDIDSDERDFDDEADEEMRDWLVYRAMAKIRARRAAAGGN